MTAAFNLNIAQGGIKGPVDITVVGLDSEEAAKTPMRILLNGISIYDGPDPLPDAPSSAPTGPADWGSYTWQVDVGLLKQGLNTITIESTDPTHRGGDPVFVAVDSVIISWGGAQ